MWGQALTRNSSPKRGYPILLLAFVAYPVNRERPEGALFCVILDVTVEVAIIAAKIAVMLA